MPFDGSKLDEVTALLVEARERIENGWCQYAYDSAEGVCMLGALGYSNDYPYPGHEPDVASLEAVSRLHEAIASRASVPEWNDTDGRTKDEVLAAFDIAIAAA